jgi:hypothetical protein
MDLDYFKEALRCYTGWKQRCLGIMGGEPLLHPQFSEICKLIRESELHGKYALWTSIDTTKSKYAEDVRETFRRVAYHPHTEDQKTKYGHQPMTIAIKDAIKDKKLRNALIDDCWLQRKWCPVVTDDGAFFCEAAASIAKLMGIKGWKLEPQWWMKRPEQFGYQKDLCQYCGISIPMETQHLSDKVEKISPSILEILKTNNLPIGEYELFDREITVEEMVAALPRWRPGIYKAEQERENFQWSTLDWSKW